MGSISLTNDGRGKAALSYSTTLNPPRTSSWRYARLFIRPTRVGMFNRDTSRAASGGEFTNHNSPSVIRFDGDIDVKYFEDLRECTHFPGTYKIYIIESSGSTLIETGTVSVSGPIGSCQDGAGDDTDEDKDEDTGDSPYGTATDGESPSEPSAPTSDPCLPAQPSPPAQTVPSPCNSSAGAGGGPTGFFGS